MNRKTYLLFVVLAFLIFWATSNGDTPYNYFTRLADAFVEGKLFITDAPSWLSELVPIGNHRFYVVQPPMPALLAVPFVFVFGKEFPQQILAHLVGAFIVLATVKIAEKFSKRVDVAVWSAILAGVGTIMWYEAATGSVWYLGQITAAVFLLWAVNESLGSRRLFLIGLLIGAAYLSRVHTILSIFFFLYLLKEKLFKFKNVLRFGLGLSVFGGFNAFYNLARWGVPWDKGYFLIPGILEEPWFSKGMLNISYIPAHLELLFWRLPNFSSEFPYVTPSWFGLAIWITTPVFVVALRNNIKKADVVFAWLSIFLIFGILSLRGGTGWTQFGYRYAVDFYPFLFYLTIKRVGKTGVGWLHWVLLILGVVVNLWGVLWINKFGWVGY